MPKLEAEETLNAMEKVDEVSIDSIVTTVYTEDGKDQIKIDYQDNKVTSISVGGRLNQKDQEYSDWFVNGISIGSTKEEVLAVYGTPTQEDILESPQKNEDTGDIYTITYCYDKEGDILEENTGEAEYTVIFFLKGESVVFYSVS